MNRPLQVGRILVSVTSDTQRLRRCSDQFDPGYIFIDSDLVAAGATGRDRGVRLPGVRARRPRG